MVVVVRGGGGGGGGVSNKNEYFQLAGFYPQQGTETTRHLGSRYLISCLLHKVFT